MSDQLRITEPVRQSRGETQVALYYSLDSNTLPVGPTVLNLTHVDKKYLLLGPLARLMSYNTTQDTPHLNN